MISGQSSQALARLGEVLHPNPPCCKVLLLLQFGTFGLSAVFRFISRVSQVQILSPLLTQVLVRKLVKRIIRSKAGPLIGNAQAPQTPGPPRWSRMSAPIPRKFIRRADIILVLVIEQIQRITDIPLDAGIEQTDARS